MQELCVADDLHFRHGRIPALAGVSLTARPGKVLAVAGPNGSGKTTLLRLLAGLESPASGRIILSGRDLREYSARARARLLAYTAQQEGGELPFSVRQAVLLGRSPWQNALGAVRPADEAEAGRALELLGLRELAGRAVSGLSGGERQRAMLARAVCQKPRLFLLDEPTAALDYGHQILVMELLRRLCREEGAAVVIVSHDLNLASMYADEVLLLKAGQAAGLGAPAEVFTEEKLGALYECAFLTDVNPCTQTPRILPLPKPR